MKKALVSVVCTIAAASLTVNSFAAELIKRIFILPRVILIIRERASW